jgi:hypothetical protein
VQSGNQLGIYLRKDRATVVCLATQGRDRKLLDCFSVGIEGAEPGLQALCDRIARACSDRKVRFAEAAVALDCASFMQHSVHSEFSDPRKIAATVRYDTEEALATDVSDVAVTFRVASTDDEGARLDVFTARRAFLTDLIQSLQVNGIDPMAIDPDVYCLSRYLIGCAEAQDATEDSTLYAALSDSRGYLVIVSGKRELATLRTFLIGPVQDRTSLLAREALVTAALATADPVGRLCAADAGGEPAVQSLHEKTGIPAGLCDLPALAGVEPGDLSDCANAVEFALAYGAALGLAEKTNSVNLRNDHMPFLGKKMRVQKAVRFLSLSLTILLLAAGVFFHSQLLRENQHREALRAKLEPDYLAVIRGKEKIPPAMSDAVRDLERALRILRAEKTGVGDQESVSARLTLVLQALNSCAKQTDLDIESITIAGNSIQVQGTTSNRRNTQLLFKAMEEGGLALRTHSYDIQGQRDKFSLTLAVVKQTQRT